jgi:hypothetical protein
VSAIVGLVKPGLSFWAVSLLVLGAGSDGGRTVLFSLAGVLWIAACIVESGVSVRTATGWVPRRASEPTGVAGLASRASELTGVAGLAGILLVLVPTLFTVFPGWSSWRLLLKLAVLFAWVLSAAIVVARTIRMEREVHSQITEAQVHALERTRHTTIDAMLMAATSYLPAGYIPQVFTPDGGRRRLFPTWDPYEIGPAEGWRIDITPPQAVTGWAWAEKEKYVYAVAGAVADATHGLTPAQQQRYSRLTGVSATAIRDFDGAPIGVLTTCTEDDQPMMREPTFVRQQIALAAELAVILNSFVKGGPLP